VVEIDHTGYFLGVLDVVGLSGDQLLRRRVADKAVEALLSPNTSPAALMGLVDIALIVEDPRLPAIMSEWKKKLSPKERAILEESEQALFSNDPSLRNDEFRLPWTDLAGFSAEHFTIHFQTSGAPPYTRDDIQRLTDDFRELASSFRKSNRFLEIPPHWRKDPDQAVDLLTDIFLLLFECFGTIPEEADAEEVAELMVDHLPRKMNRGVEEFEAIPHLLEAFFRFLTDDFSKEEGDEFASFIRACEEEMIANVQRER
jgi:hypothetical protein